MNTMIFQNKTANWTGKKFLEILTKRDFLFFFLNKKKCRVV